MTAFAAEGEKGDMPDSKPTGIIGTTYEEERPVVYKLWNELPPERIRVELPWFTVVSWDYDGDANNGMPNRKDNERMIRLETALDENILREGFCRHAYSRTGNGRSLLELFRDATKKEDSDNRN